MVVHKKTSQSIFDKEFELDERTKKAFAEIIKKAKKEKFDPRKHDQTIICGEKEFRESERSKKKVIL